MGCEHKGLYYPRMSSEFQNKTLLFVTGRLAEASLGETVRALSQRLNFQYHIAVPGIQVAALMHVDLLLNRLQIPAGTVILDRVPHRP